MKKILLPVAAVVAVGAVACADQPTMVAPEGANFELVDKELRIDEETVNAHVYGSFALSFGSEGGWGTILTGPANFPGNAKNAGTCDLGLWINPREKRTFGTEERPHPHCVGYADGDQIQVVLEPISVHHSGEETSGERLRFTKNPNDGSVDVSISGGVGGPTEGTEGVGTILAYAIDASTLGTTNKRVGTLEIDLSQLTDANTNRFAEDCTLDVSEVYARCLNKQISATYTPLAAPDGVGEVTTDVLGFFYWTEAGAPFNYADND